MQLNRAKLWPLLAASLTAGCGGGGSDSIVVDRRAFLVGGISEGTNALVAQYAFGRMEDVRSLVGQGLSRRERLYSLQRQEASILGRRGRNIAAEDALAHVWGYTIINDVTARDLQGLHSQWLIGKSQDTFCPMGPWAVTADSLDLADTSVRCLVNDEPRQDSNTGLLIFDVPTIIAALSNGITLEPGDVIATGTPAGVGLGFKPPKYLVPGDRVRLEIGGIGTLENPVETYRP